MLSSCKQGVGVSGRGGLSAPRPADRVQPAGRAPQQRHGGRHLVALLLRGRLQSAEKRLW